MKTLTVTLLLIGFSVTTISAQILEKRQGVFRLGQQVIVSDSYLDPDEVADTIRTNAVYLTNITAAYGLTNRLSVNIAWPVFVRSTVNEVKYNQTGNTLPGKAINSVGDAEVGIRYAFRTKLPVQIIGYVTLGLPLGEKGNVGLDTDVQTGDGEFNQLIGLQVGQTFSNFYALAYGAFNNRSEDFSNDIRYGLKLGYAGDKLAVEVRYTGIESLFNDTAPVSQNGIFSNHREIFSPGAELQYIATKSIRFFTSIDWMVAGRNTLNAPLFGAGIELRR